LNGIWLAQALLARRQQFHHARSGEPAATHAG
jgi:hypothetical protein